jgi:hypothetical protein
MPILSDAQPDGRDRRSLHRSHVLSGFELRARLRGSGGEIMMLPSLVQGVAFGNLLGDITWNRLSATEATDFSSGGFFPHWCYVPSRRTVESLGKHLICARNCARTFDQYSARS